MIPSADGSADRENRVGAFRHSHPGPRSKFQAWAGDPRGGLVLLLLCLTVYLPGLRAIPPVDRDESRFAQATRQMVQSGDYVIPRIQDRPRLNKPPLIYWLQSAGVRALGDEDSPRGIWVYRLPSVLAATLTVLLTWRLGRSMFDARAAWLGAAMLAVCPMVVWDAHQARADQVLLTTVVATQWALFSIWRGGVQGRGSLVVAGVFWTCLSFGLLAKGPITPMIAALTAIVLCIHTRRWAWLRRLRPVLGLSLVAAIVGPWVYVAAHRVGWSTYLSVLNDEILGRSTAPKEGHWGPPGYHLIALVVLFWPGVMLAWTGLRRAWSKAPRNGFRHAELFALAWIVPSWIVFELVGTKLPHYTMPLYPPLALLTARAVLAASAPGGWTRLGLASWPSRVGLSIWLLAGLALAASGLGIVLASRHAGLGPDRNILLLAAAGALLAGIFLAVGGTQLDRRLPLHAMRWALAAAVVTCIVLLGIAIPRSPAPWTSVRLAEALKHADPRGSRPTATVEYHEDSLIFLTRGRAQRLNADGIDAWLAAHPDGLVILPESEYDQHDSLTAVSDIDPISGYNYSTGRLVRLIVCEASR